MEKYTIGHPWKNPSDAPGYKLCYLPASLAREVEAQSASPGLAENGALCDTKWWYELIIPAVDSARKLFTAWFTGVKMEKIRATVLKSKRIMQEKPKEFITIFHLCLNRISVVFRLSWIEGYTADNFRIFKIILPIYSRFIEKIW